LPNDNRLHPVSFLQPEKTKISSPSGVFAVRRFPQNAGRFLAGNRMQKIGKRLPEGTSGEEERPQKYFIPPPCEAGDARFEIPLFFPSSVFAPSDFCVFGSCILKKEDFRVFFSKRSASWEEPQPSGWPA
jgi:hypothetical protein